MDVYNLNARPHSFIWSNGKRMCAFTFPSVNQSIEDNFILQEQNCKPLQYKKHNQEIENTLEILEIPLSVGITEYYYYILHEDGLVIVSRITMKVAARYDLSKLGKIIGMTYLAEFNLQLIYFKTHIIQISVKDEEKDVWILYLDQKSYKEAY